MNDTSIVEQIFARKESGLDELSRKYARLYRGILGEMLDDPCDIDECANDVLLAVWNSIPPNRPAGLAAYICKIARRIATDRLRYNTRQKRNTGYTVALSELEECLPASPEPADGESDEESRQIREILSGFIRNLDPETEVLFVRRYMYLENVAELAKRFEMNENLVSVKLYRARKKLKKLLEKEGIQV